MVIDIDPIKPMLASVTLNPRLLMISKAAPTRFLTLAITLLPLFHHASAALILEETFTTGTDAYTANGKLFGQQFDGIGSTDTWAGANPTNSRVVADTTNLSFEALSNSGTGSLGLKQLAPAFGSTANSFMNSVGLSAYGGGSTLWFAALMRSTQTTTTFGSYVGLLADSYTPVSGTGGSGTPNSTAIWGNGGGAGANLNGFSFGFNGPNLVANYQSGSSSVSSSNVVSGYTSGTTYLIVSKLELDVSGTTDRLTVYNVIDGSTLPSPALTIDSNFFANGSELDTLVTYQRSPIGSATSVFANFDAIRFGTSLAEVTPGLNLVPEPSVCFLFALGLTSTIILSRRRLRYGE